ncbi:MAG TPA: hypothetical protein VGC21_13245 [Telluria sp.]|jgi:hypothetical protein
MRKPHPDVFDAIPISHSLSIRLGFAKMMGAQDHWEIVEEAVEDWLRKHQPDACGEPQFAGYQWKSLFLPHGTVLRTVFKGKHHHCRVENEQIVHEGAGCSPNGFVSAVGGIRRNAWKSIWLLLPDAKHWQLADTLRVRRHAVAARRTVHAARPIRGVPAPVAAPAVRLADLVPARTARDMAPSTPPLPADPGPASVPPAPRAPVSLQPSLRPAFPPGQVGQGAAEASMLFAFPLTGHYRWTAWRPGP